TDAHGAFTLPLPAGRTLPDAQQGRIQLGVHGAHQDLAVPVEIARIASNGLLPAITLPAVVDPLPTSIVASLAALLPAPGAEPPPKSAPGPLPTVKIGEEGSCGLTFNQNAGIDRFPFSVFVRLVEPRTSIVTPAFRLFRGEDSRAFFPVTAFGSGPQLS